MKTYVVPLPSERCTTTIGELGNFTPGFTFAIAASFQLVIFPMKMSGRGSAR